MSHYTEWAVGVLCHEDGKPKCIVRLTIENENGDTMVVSLTPTAARMLVASLETAAEQAELGQRLMEEDQRDKGGSA